MSYRPLPEELTIKESAIDGLGVFAAKDINTRNDFAIVNTHFEFYIDKDKSRLLRLPVGGFINHSSNPNVTLKITDKSYNDNKYNNWKYYGIFPIKDIKAGEEITLDYTKELCGLNCYKDEEWLK